MAGKPTSVLVDTNVWLDLCLPDRAGSAESSAAIRAAFQHDIALFYTAAQATDLFFLTGAHLKALERARKGIVTAESAAAINAVCWSLLDHIDEFATVVGADAADLWLAKKYRGLHRDFEDNLVLAAAERANADLVVTKDEELIKHAPLAAVTPSDFLRLIEAFETEAD